MQTDGNSFFPLGDVVLDSVNMAYKDEACLINLYNLCKAKSFGRFKILRVIEENAYLKKYITLHQGTRKIGFLCFSIASMRFVILL